MTLWSRAVLLAWLIGGLWALELIDQLIFHGALDAAGIHPRDPGHWWGILAAPFLHGGIAHIAANSIPLFVLGLLVLLRGLANFIAVSLTAMVVGGSGVFLFADPRTVHIGASGVIFGFLGYLLLRGYFERSFGAILIAIVVMVLYGGALFGVLPGQPGISWEGHLFGFLSGATAARLFKRGPSATPLERSRLPSHAP
jgi:membrane associated rhomboid family serine protease